MTQDEALQEARRRWGDKAYVNDFRHIAPTLPFIVYLGREDADGAGWPRYRGDSWEAAFADADRRSSAEHR